MSSRNRKYLSATPNSYAMVVAIVVALLLFDLWLSDHTRNIMNLFRHLSPNLPIYKLTSTFPLSHRMCRLFIEARPSFTRSYKTYLFS